MSSPSSQRKQFHALETQTEAEAIFEELKKYHIACMEKDNEQESTNNLQHIDYKNVTAIEAHLNPHARMMSRRRTRMSAKGQRDFARAVKRARFMALVPYISH